MREVHLHSLRNGRGSLSEGLRRYMFVVDLSIGRAARRVCGFKPGHVCLGLSDFGLE